MRFLVLSDPGSGPIVPEQLPSLFAAEAAWRERYSDQLEVYGWFVAGGGFGIAGVDDDAMLCRMVAEHPFTPFSKLDVRPIVDADVGAAQWRETFAAGAAV